MHVLLINCHSNSDENNKTWKEFERLVRKCFSHMMEMMHFTVRNLNELAEYLDSRYFDKIDFIFVDGDKTFKPWTATSKPLISLLKMCCQVGFKCVFGTAPLLTSLCFVIAIGGQDTKIKGKGGSIASLQQGDVEFSADYLYLNNRTGDAFQSVSTDSGHVWKPVVNIGLKVHVPPHPQSDIPRSVSESLLKKSKKFLHHWAFAGIPDQFVVPTASHFWDVSDVPAWISGASSSPSCSSASPSSSSSVSSSTIKTSLAASMKVSPRDSGSPLNILAHIECGPAMLEYDCIMAVHFAVTEIYPHTVNILHNYIKTALDIMMNFGNQPYPSHRLFRKLTAVGNFSKFEERPKPIATPARTQPFPDPQPPLSSATIIPKPKIPLSPLSPLSPSSSPFPHASPLFPLSQTSLPLPPSSFPISSSPVFHKTPSYGKSGLKLKKDKDKDKEKDKEKLKDKEKDRVSLPVVRVPPTTKSPLVERKRPWHTPPESMLYD